MKTEGFMPSPVGSLTSKDFVEHRAAKPDNQQLSEALQKCHIAPPSGEKLNYESSNRRDFYSRERSRRWAFENCIFEYNKTGTYFFFEFIQENRPEI